MASVGEHERDRPRPSGGPIWLRVVAYARPYLPFIALTLVLTLAGSAAELGRVYLLKPLVDTVVLPYASHVRSPDLRELLPRLGSRAREERAARAPQAPAAAPGDEAALATIRSNLGRILLAGALLVLVLPLVSFAREYVAAWALGRIRIDMQRDACAKLLALPLGFHLGRRRGDVYTRVANDLSQAHGALILVFGDVAESISTVVLGLALMIFVSWKLSLLALAVAPIIFVVVSLFGRRIRASARRRQQQFAEVTQRLLEILAGIKVIKAFRAEGAEHAAYRADTAKLFRRTMKVVKNRLLARSLVDLLNQVMIYGAIVFGILVMGLWRISIGEVFAFLLISNHSFRPVRKLARAWGDLMDAQASAVRFFEVMDTPVDLRDAPDAVAIGPLRGDVVLRDVWFSYGEGPVLRGISFEARAGEVVAIVGRTGAGKTTLSDLLLRFYDPERGQVLVDGVDLRRITRDSYLAQIAVVTQEPFLFDGTIRDNLRYGRLDATDDEVLAAARAAHVDEFVHELPRGYDTEVGPSGVRLSGGQRQRITIGRAILRDPAILIFDEATSSLDSKSEKYVQEAVEALLGGRRTVFVIAHRLSTVRRADRILVLERGELAAQGTHEELMEARGLYRELVELQSSSPAPAPAAR